MGNDPGQVFCVFVCGTMQKLYIWAWVVNNAPNLPIIKILVQVATMNYPNRCSAYLDNRRPRHLGPRLPGTTLSTHFQVNTIDGLHLDKTASIPGLQLRRRHDNNGTVDGILGVVSHMATVVIDSAQAFRSEAPHNGGGYGSQWYGTLDNG